MNRFILFVPLVGFTILAGLFFLTIDRKDKDVLPSPLVGQPFPEFEMVSLETGEVVTRDDLLGKRALVNVWATWCPTCKAEHSFLNLLAAEGIRIYGINYKDEERKAIQWLASYGNPYRWNLSDTNGQLGLELGVYGAPETFLLDSRGIIRGRHVGDLNARVWSTLEPEFESLP
ncbi:MULTISPECIES: DsbE family thiol:disulfide interchange protein [unclassified Oceanobacter]|jgi:cytochrome c biogenesis protein CcmG/thiol:disulfide interchange protein DsbE|uniref:DsbE family thiol:disulfide interchange protein n=1 Tax=unclassified Oceanobacter TaxID=2620260 RepID=UPI0026E3FED4|nr:MULTISPECIES: DsbE family thiol:disulfide interchange protein [unclassified Oceanobacter]MDO6682515.1 DsbE family thiol:disulfide interchange protein [Oceanobacter sp. 5_MG-2023]MDP2506470.1 DsbE family thiol:disulfide interchange protein [Oceanobacter sp. 3_MG-2023]MDP2549021.1 DsbE family thiol:disulfide interchange protein [Oceanobacter sp. 4_MG-2023]MDP2609155.1 DsbE family thiol:disulfide interchange protein [Oceanobacter sp. 1_MG-2023]MDP2612553.1 DsbE family thiol:disulfide interchan